MKSSIVGHLLPESEAEFADHYGKMKIKSCLSCSEKFAAENTHTQAGWKETQISGFCENCFDRLIGEGEE